TVPVTVPGTRTTSCRTTASITSSEPLRPKTTDRSPNDDYTSAAGPRGSGVRATARRTPTGRSTLERKGVAVKCPYCGYYSLTYLPLSNRWVCRVCNAQINDEDMPR